MKKPLVEFVGTFFLTFTVATAAVLGSGGTLAAFAIGIVLAVMIYAGGHISGGHYNPSVTLSVFIRARCPAKDLVPYFVAQLAAAVVAAWLAKNVMAPALGEAAKITPFVAGNTGAIVLAEFLFTFALTWVVLCSATAKATAGNSFYGLAIGGTVLVGAITVGGISLGAFNPAVTTLLVVIGKLPVADCWMHLLPQIIASVASAILFRFTHADDY
jgi:aquaporin Z